MTRNTNRVTYLDGRTEEVQVSMFEQRLAARYMRDHNCGTIMEDPVTYSAYQAYVKLRQNGRTNTPFDDWLKTVESVEDIKHHADDDEEDPANPSTGGTQEA